MNRTDIRMQEAGILALQAILVLDAVPFHNRPSHLNKSLAITLPGRTLPFCE
jgi:hypothetical protein